MNKLLLTTALLAATAGAASAEITLSGSGRFGLVYDDTAGVGQAETTLAYRLRVNVNAKFEADNGVTYGGRIRFQNAQNTAVADTGGDRNAAEFSPAMLYVEASGVRVEVGNANTAIDSVALMYNPEIGFTESSYGDPQGSFFSFSSGPYAVNRVGVYAAYSVSGVNLKASYVQADQNDTTDDANETSIAADYTMGQFTVAAAYADKGAGIVGNYVTFVGVAYKVNDVANVGLNYNDNGTSGFGKTTTIYGNYTINGITLGAYVSDSDAAAADTAYGLGAAYDLGGATLAGAIHSGFAGETYADLGVRMSF
ncbi:porin [Cypionkella sp.]|uniref:porin n=1 Tax=Cypionkella sp. TaxID=2811411 RepID=UPI00271D09CC|nr:porin [Cypionkella sp.]MDO8985165.1 porin [Cypionkella sp.]MDP1577463.1 porin [Cypionkella sp.]MDP2047278.1 porin [Cypionkella sp.]